jgi:hypothetical protein
MLHRGWTDVPSYQHDRANEVKLRESAHLLR